MASWQTIRLIQGLGPAIGSIPQGIATRKKRKYESAVRQSASSFNLAEKKADDLKASRFQVAPEIVATPNPNYPDDPTTNIYSVKEFRDVPGFGPVYGQAIPEGPGPIEILEQQKIERERARTAGEPVEPFSFPAPAKVKTSRVEYETKGGRGRGTQTERDKAALRDDYQTFAAKVFGMKGSNAAETMLQKKIRTEIIGDVLKNSWALPYKDLVEILNLSKSIIYAPSDQEARGKLSRFARMFKYDRGNETYSNVVQKMLRIFRDWGEGKSAAEKDGKLIIKPPRRTK